MHLRDVEDVTLRPEVAELKTIRSERALSNSEIAVVSPTASRTRARILTYLASVGSVTDPSGHANKVLREALGFTGSTGAFTQMLASMDQAGLLAREVKGRRTYRIALGAAAGVPINAADRAMGRAPAGDGGTRMDPSLTKLPSQSPARSDASAAGGDSLDYDELAFALLRSVASLLRGVAAPEEAPEAASPNLSSAASNRRIVNLERTVTSLERDLARARAERNEIAEERTQLKAQLEAAEKNLEVLRERVGPRRPDARTRLGDDEALILRRLSQRSPGSREQTRPSDPVPTDLPRSSARSYPAKPEPVPGWPRQRP